MSEAKHTPDPWLMLPEEADKDYIRIRGGMLGSRFKIANVITPTYPGVHARELEETRANARLMIASPDLLKACLMGDPLGNAGPCLLMTVADMIKTFAPNAAAELERKADAEAKAIAKATGKEAS